MRSLFCSKSGHTLVSADFKQIELRIFAHLAGDEDLCDILNDDSKDIFDSIAEEIFSKDELECDLDKSIRNKVKELCYSILYGSQKHKHLDSNEELEDSNKENCNLKKYTNFFETAKDFLSSRNLNENYFSI